MKILNFQAENVKKLRVIDITPQDNMVVIAGKNGQGKTSVLDAIWWAITGAEHIQARPIRTGADKAYIRLDLGELIVTRRFTRQEDGSANSSIIVENTDGARYPSPQRMLDALFGELSFDPLDFNRKKPKAQFDELKRFVEGVDFEAMAKERQEQFDKRTGLGRDVKRAQAAADAIVLPDDCPTERRDVDELIQKLDEAGQKNARIQTEASGRQSDLARAEHFRERSNEALNRAKTLREQAAAIIKQAEQLERDAAEAEKTADELKESTMSLPPLPDPVDTAAIRAEIQSARDHNELVDKWRTKKEQQEQAERLQADVDAITAWLAEHDKKREDIIRAAKLPVEGLGFGDGFVTFNGEPFEQASDAEQLRASIAIAMASNPKLRVIRVRDGSYLDSEGMAILADMAREKDYQVWIERVDESGTVGFVLEDGHLKGVEVDGDQAEQADDQ